MHGIPRKALSEEEQQSSSAKALKLRDLQSQVLQFHHNRIYTPEALEISAKLVESNPEHYTVWNYRKLAVQHLLDGCEKDSDSIQSILDEELRLVENALRKNFKSYGAWYHRKWILSKGHSSTDKELRLLGKFQKLDARNFHAWNYRRFVTALKKVPDEEELQYTTDMIYDNFSNYSAWHNRSILLSNLLEKKEKGYENKEHVLGEEYEFVRNALFTDPDDQSGWMYHLWLLDQTIKQEPLCLSSWPPEGSNLFLLLEGHYSRQQASPILYYKSKAKTFPFVLYFSEPVEGVSSSTVKIECEYHVGNDVLWTPLSANRFGFAHAWMTHLTFPDEVCSLEACPLKVIVAESIGIQSLRGVSCGQSSRISFTVSIFSGDQDRASEQSPFKISWKEENFRSYDARFHEPNLLLSFPELEALKEEKPTTLSEGTVETILNEISHCRELLSSTDCKIGKLTLARLLTAHDTLMSQGRPNVSTSDHYDEILAMYLDLMKLDPSHTCYYKDQYSLVLIKQATSHIENLLKYSNHYQESSSPNSPAYSCLRFNGLSLSRIGSVERLLWVQILDLSHNKLSSIEGLEALQLLSCLKLSHNKLSSFTALEPLKVLSSLQVLDISNNEIGAHSIDSRRYLCSSPLNHTFASDDDWNLEKYVNGDVSTTDFWDAFLIFNGLNLMQLEIAGNPVASDRLKGFLFRLMPTLVWLDEEDRR